MSIGHGTARALAAVALAGAVAAMSAPVAVAADSSTSPQDELAEKKAQAELDKLNLEIEKLRDENTSQFYEKPSFWTAVGGGVAALGLVGTLIGLALTQSNQAQQRSEHETQRLDQENERIEQAKRDRQQRSDEHFAALSAALASDSAGQRVSAVAGIESFLREKDATYRLQLFDLLRGVLTVGHDETSDRVIARTFIKVLKQCMREIREHEAIAGGATIDLQDVWIPSVDAGGLDLSGIEGSGICLNRASIDGTKFDGSTLAGARLSRVTGNSGTSFRNVVMPGVTLQSASLAGVDMEGARLVPPRRSGLEPATADLADADLRGARLVDARLDRARLISVDFERAILTGASLKGAQLQQADFRHADLTGNTRLHGANVANADFRGARLGETARTSLVATNWSRAVLDAETLAWLEAHK